MNLTYTKNYQIKIWKNDLIIDLLLFKTRDDVDKWRNENKNIKLRYNNNDKITHTLEQ